jgi:hypothetical protein
MARPWGYGVVLPGPEGLAGAAAGGGRAARGSVIPQEGLQARMRMVEKGIRINRMRDMRQHDVSIVRV